MIAIESFGYIHGIPRGGDFVIDLRDAIRDPHIDPRLRQMTGLDDAVYRHVLATAGADELIEEILRKIEVWPNISRSGVLIGCQGGRHRSVVIAEEVARRLREQGTDVSLSHRHVTRPVIFARGIAPRRVGGRYSCGYWGQEYTVLGIETDRDTWPAWQITIRWADGREASHCTAWDPEKDRVIS